MAGQRPSPLLIGSMPRRRFLHTLGAAGGAALLGSAGLPQRVHARRGTIRIFNNETDPDTIAFLKAMAKTYRAETGVRVKIETVPVMQTTTKVTTAIKAGKPYDFIIFFTNLAILLAEDGHLLPMTDIIREVGVDDFGPRALRLFKDDYWLYPYDYNFNYMLYRKDLFAEKGLQVPTDWNEFLEVLRALNDPDNKNYAITLPYGGVHTNWGNTGFLWAAGVEFYDDEWNVVLDSDDNKPRAIRTLEFLVEVAKYTPPGPMETSLKDMLINFSSGLSAITSYTGRAIHTIEDRNPELADKYGIMSYPAPDGGRGAVTYGDDGFSIGKTENSDLTVDFFRWFLDTDRLIDYQLTVPLHYQPTQFSTYENEKWRSHPLIEKHAEAIETMRGFMNTDKTLVGSIDFQGPRPSPNHARLAIAGVIPKMYQNVLMQRLTPSEAVDAAAEEIRGFTTRS